MWICWVCLDLPMALLMGAFFVVQGAVIAIERVTGQKGWPRGLRHPWTLGWMLAACPLFVEPFLRIVS